MLEKVLRVVKMVHFYSGQFIPIIELIVQKDINKDGKIG